MKTSRRNTLITGLILSVCLAAGCGYRNLAYRHRGTSVYFPIMGNNTMEPAVELTLTNIIREELLRAGLTLAGEETADWLLNGVVTSYTRSPLSYYTHPEEGRRRRTRAHLYRLTVTARMTLAVSAPAEQGKPQRSKEGVLTETTTYFLDGPYARTEAEALTILAGNLAKRTVEWLTDY